MLQGSSDDGQTGQLEEGIAPDPLGAPAKKEAGAQIERGKPVSNRQGHGSRSNLKSERRIETLDPPLTGCAVSSSRWNWHGDGMAKESCLADNGAWPAMPLAG